MPKSWDSKIRHLIEALISAFLFVFQYIPVAGPWYGIMIFPLALYISGLWWTEPDLLGAQINLLLFSQQLMFGRIVAVTGFMIFLGASVHFLRRKEKINTTGLYSVVRHPQYFGIIIVTLGMTIMCIQFKRGHPPELTNIWLLQVLGYILLAAYEERYLMREHEREYQQYRDKVPFIFPIPRLNKIPEPLVSIVLALFVMFLLMNLINPYL